MCVNIFPTKNFYSQMYPVHMTAGLTDDFRIPEDCVTMRLSKIKVSLNIILFIVKKKKKSKDKTSPNFTK